MSSRDTFLAELVDHLTARDVGHPLRVGVDGTCGSGKSTLAGELASVISAQGRAAIHLDSDGFHNIRAIRYRRGRTSARGYLQVDRDIAVSRGVARDAAVLGGAVGARQAYEDRYMAACDIYVREERPAERASILVAYDDLVNSRILRGVESLSAELDRS